MSHERIKIERALAWVGFVIVAVAAAVVFLFSTFQTSAEADKQNQNQDSRLDRIEKKVDLILERSQ